MPKIYVAGPLLNGHTAGDEVGYKNAEKAFYISWQLMQKGWSPYIPHASMYMYVHLRDKEKVDIPWETWMQLDSAFIKSCQAIFFIGHSKGADIELKWANDHDLKLYTHIDQVPTVPPERDLLG